MLEIVQAGIKGAAGGQLVKNALKTDAVNEAFNGSAVTLIAAGKAAGPMASSFLSNYEGRVKRGLVATSNSQAKIEPFETIVVGHPIPTEASEMAGRRVLEVAQQVPSEEQLVVLLSGGASAGLTVPVANLTLEQKAQATHALLRSGLSIYEVNSVRKHLSGIKGGRLAAACRGEVITLAVSDVIGSNCDDPSVIGSGPTTADPSTFHDAIEVLARNGKMAGFPEAALDVLLKGGEGKLPETLKPGDSNLRRSQFHTIGNRNDAMNQAEKHATTLGYYVKRLNEPVTGEASVAGNEFMRMVVEMRGSLKFPFCLLSSGETTVRVTGGGRGGRNQEFGLAAARLLSENFERGVLASIGTDGIDGPTDAAGAIVDSTTLQRASDRGLGSPERYLAKNDSYSFFDVLGDLVVTGSTETNVGDLQVILIG